MTINDFMRNAAANASDSLKQRALGAWNSLRGTARAGAAEYGSWNPSTSYDEYGPAGTAEPNPYTTGRAAEAKWGPQGSPEAQAYRASQAGGGGQPPVGEPPAAAGAPKPGFLRRAGTTLGRVGKAAGIAGFGLSALDAGMKASEGQTPEQLTGQGGENMGAATEFYDNLTFGQGRKFAHGVKRTLGAVPSLRTPQDSGFPVRPGVMGLADRFGQGWEEGKSMESAAKGRLAGAPVQLAMADGNTPPPATERTQDRSSSEPLVPLASGNRATPEALIAMNGQSAEYPAEGFGAFKRTTPGNEGSAVSVGTAGSDSLAGASAQSESIRAGENGSSSLRGRGPQPVGSNRTDAGYNNPSAIQGAPRDAAGRPAPAGAPAGTQSASVSSTGGLRDVPVLPAVGWGAPRANRLNMQAQVEARGQDATYASNLIQRQIQLAQMDYQHGQDNEKRIQDQVKQYAEAKSPVKSGFFKTTGEAEAQRKSDVATSQGELERNLRYTEGSNFKRMTPERMQGHLLSHEMMKQTQEARSNWPKAVKDFVGNARFESRNYNDWEPDHLEKSSIPGVAHWVVLKSGERVPVTDVAGGKWNILSANEPIDLNQQRRILSAHQQAKQEAKSKGANTKDWDLSI